MPDDGKGWWVSLKPGHKCPFCQRKSPLPRGLKYHIRVSHQGKTMPRIEAQTCRHCKTAIEAGHYLIPIGTCPKCWLKL